MGNTENSLAVFMQRIARALHNHFEIVHPAFQAEARNSRFHCVLAPHDVI